MYAQKGKFRKVRAKKYAQKGKLKKVCTEIHARKYAQ